MEIALRGPLHNTAFTLRSIWLITLTGNDSYNEEGAAGTDRQSHYVNGSDSFNMWYYENEGYPGKE